MRVAELRYPGSFLADATPEAHQTQTLLFLLEGHLADAAIALDLFKRATATRPRRPFDEYEAYGGYETRRRLEDELRAQLPRDLSPDARWAAEGDVRDRAETMMKRHAWQAGHVPSSYEFRLPFIHARTFVYALDGIIKALEQVAASPGAPGGVTEAVAALKAAVPFAVDVRDSAHHVEDRARGKGRKGRDLPRQPIHSHGIEAPHGGVTVTNYLHGNRLAYTVASGHVRDVEVSEETLAHAQSAVQATLDAFEWKGPPRTVP